MNVLIVDDEPLARDRLSRLVGDLEGYRVLEPSATNGEEALTLIDSLKPDVVLLDIRMPGKTGMEAARDIGAASQVVFVTAYDQYAIDAFEQGAMDYLLKPVSDERLLATRERILSRLPSTRQDDAVLERLLQRLGPSQAGAERPPLAWITASNGR